VIEGSDSEAAVIRKPVKSDAAFRTISEVSEDLDVPQHVLRFWESKFTQIKPLKRGGGRRYYRPEDLQLLKRIRDLLYKDGYTIRGVQKLLRDQTRGPGNGGETKPEVSPSKDALLSVNRPVETPNHKDVKAVQPELQLEPSVRKLTVGKVKSGDVRSELNSLLGELESLRSLLSEARQH
jgi:DNA-binding transcriptional MerR regulator